MRLLWSKNITAYKFAVKQLVFLNLWLVTQILYLSRQAGA